MATPFPDVEIYIKDPDPEKILHWLGQVFDAIDVKVDAKVDVNGGTDEKHTKKMTITATIGKEQVQCVFLRNAVKGNFASLWFRSAATPWTNDRDCAASAYQYLQTEIRCSTGTWQPTDSEDDETWLCFNSDGESTVSWKT
jgi:hypothetical protein